VRQMTKVATFCTDQPAGHINVATFRTGLVGFQCAVAIKQFSSHRDKIQKRRAVSRRRRRTAHLPQPARGPATLLRFDLPQTLSLPQRQRARQHIGSQSPCWRPEPRRTPRWRCGASANLNGCGHVDNASALPTCPSHNSRRRSLSAPDLEARNSATRSHTGGRAELSSNRPQIPPRRLFLFRGCAGKKH